MGVTCKPFGKLRSDLQKIENDQIRERKLEKTRKKEINKTNETVLSK